MTLASIKKLGKQCDGTVFDNSLDILKLMDYISKCC
jgi:hypothetical protein